MEITKGYNDIKSLRLFPEVFPDDPQELNRPHPWGTVWCADTFEWQEPLAPPLPIEEELLRALDICGESPCVAGDGTGGEKDRAYEECIRCWQCCLYRAHLSLWNPLLSHFRNCIKSLEAHIKVLQQKLSQCLSYPDDNPECNVEEIRCHLRVAHLEIQFYDLMSRLIQALLDAQLPSGEGSNDVDSRCAGCGHQHIPFRGRSKNSVITNSLSFIRGIEGTSNSTTQPQYRGQYKVFESGTSNYIVYAKGDTVSYKNTTYIANKEIKGGGRPDTTSNWDIVNEADITGISITADAGLTGTIWTHNGFHYQDITVATGGITTAHIADNAITSSKIADGAILGVDVAVGVTLTNPDITGDAEVFGNVYITGTAAGQLNSGERNNPVLSISGTYRDVAVDCGAGGISAGFAKSTFHRVVTNSTAVNSIVAAGGISGDIIRGNTGTFKNIILTQGLSAQDGLIDGLTGNFNNIVAHGGISASGMTLGAASVNFLGGIASVTAVSAGKVVADISKAGAIELDSLTGVSAEGNYIRGYTGTFKNVELVQGLSAQDGLIEGYTGEFQQIVSHGGISCGGNIELNNSGDIALVLKADSDNSGENDNPLIQLSQDGGGVAHDIGIVGDAGQIFTNSKANAFYVNQPGAASIQFAVNDTARYTINAGGMNQFHSGISAEGATFGGGVIIHGGVSAGGISTDNIHVKSGISAGTLVTGNTADFTSLVGAKGVSAAGATIGGYWAGQQEEIIGIAINNGLDVITTGKKGHRVIPYDCEVTEWTVTSSDSGSIQFDINSGAHGNWPNLTSVGGSSLPSLSNQSSARDASVNWAKTTFFASDIIEFEVDSVSGVTACTLNLHIRRTGE